MFYLINKPVGITSFDVIRVLRKKLNTKKMWHIGTLDPLASGLILIATNQSTKLLSLINSYKKTYSFSVSIDWTTASLDLWEPIIPHSIDNKKLLTNKELKEKIESQTSQIPPQFSALHINGKRAYELARNGENFQIPERKITVSDVEILENSLEKISVRLTISAGGYIRSFAPLIGQWCGTQGGYITELRREKLFFENFFLDKSLSQDLDNFDESNFIDEKTLFPNFLFLESNDKNLEIDIKNGKKISLENIFPNKNQYIILDFWTYSSLLEYKNWEFIIKRNDILDSSHKNHKK